MKGIQLLKRISRLLLFSPVGYMVGGLVTMMAPGLIPVSALGQTNTDFALSFNGVSDSVVVANNPLVELTSGTIELWFRPDWAPGSLGYDPVLIANSQGPILTRYAVQVDRNLAGISLANGTSISTVHYPFARGQWYHLAVAGNAATAQVYVNGRPVGSTSNGFGTLIVLPLNLGSDGLGAFFPGQMDEVRIWNVARNGDDIQRNIARALAGNDAGLVAYWRMNEGIGMTAVDATANRLDATLNGPAWTNSGVVLVNTTGSFWTALDLVAARGSYVQAAGPAGLGSSNQLTFETWIKPRSAQCGTIVSRGDGLDLASTDFIFQVGTDGTNCGAMNLALMVAGVWTSSASTVPLNQWTHVAVSWDGLTNRFYINGVLDTAVAATGNMFQSGSSLLIGRQGTGGANYFDGMLDEVRIWNMARSAAQIQTNLRGAIPANEPGLMGYWRFDEQAGIQALDASGRHNHGTLMNRPVRVPSFWAPVVALKGGNAATQECHAPFLDQRATVKMVPSTLLLAVGESQPLALRPDGTVAALWGPAVPADATNVIAVSVGYDHCLALKADGTVIGWGQNSGGQLNIPGGLADVVAVAAGYSHSLALRGDGRLFAWGSDAWGSIDIPAGATNIVAILTGSCASHNLAVQEGGKVYAWGRNYSGQINVPSRASGVVAVAAGCETSVALRADGTVVVWGDGHDGETNLPPSANNLTAIACGTYHIVALRADGRVVAWGWNDNGQTSVPSNLVNVMGIAAADESSLALKADGAIVNWPSYSSYTNTGILAIPVTVRGTVNSNAPGTYVLSYTATNAVGAVVTATRRVVVADTTAPVVVLNGANPLNLDAGGTFFDPGATARDACGGDLTASIIRTGSVDPLVPAAYTLTYTVSDPTGNTTATNRIVLVRSAPSILGFQAYSSGTNAITGSPVVQFLAGVNPNGLATTAFAQYGLNTTYPGATAPVNLPASYDTSSFFATLDGLLPGVTYHFRIAASNSLGVVRGPDQTFTVPLFFRAGDLNGDGRVDQAELQTILSNYWSNNTWPTLTNPAALGGGLFQAALTNVPILDLSVLVSTNLADWQLLPGLASPVWQFLDPAATNQQRRFYRLQWP
jgi:hypothetical protein